VLHGPEDLGAVDLESGQLLASVGHQLAQCFCHLSFNDGLLESRVHSLLFRTQVFLLTVLLCILVIKGDLLILFFSVIRVVDFCDVLGTTRQVELRASVANV